MKRITDWWNDTNYNHDGAPIKVALVLGMFVALALIIWFFVVAPLIATVVLLGGGMLTVVIMLFWLIASIIWEDYL